MLFTDRGIDSINRRQGIDMQYARRGGDEEGIGLDIAGII